MHRVAPSVRRQPSGAILSAFALAIVLTAAQRVRPAAAAHAHTGARAGRNAHDRPARERPLDVQPRRRPGRVRFRELPLHGRRGPIRRATWATTGRRASPSLRSRPPSASETARSYGKVSAVGERTFAAPPSLVGEDASSFKVEDLSLGWRSGKSIGSSENLLDFTVGRTQYKIGHGLLLWDGARRGRQPRRLLEQRTQGLAVRGGRRV